MPVHIFQVDETNFEICRKYGLAGIFDAERGNINDTLISRLSLMRIGDPVLFYVGRSSIKKRKAKKSYMECGKFQASLFMIPAPSGRTKCTLTASVWKNWMEPYLKPLSD